MTTNVSISNYQGQGWINTTEKKIITGTRLNLNNVKGKNRLFNENKWKILKSRKFVFRLAKSVADLFNNVN
jgi:hypothetical protein